MFESASGQTTAEKGTANATKETRRVHASIQSKEERIGELQNETARIKVDSLNTVAHNKELKATSMTVYHCLSINWFCHVYNINILGSNFVFSFQF